MSYEIDFLAVGDNGRSGDAIAARFGNLGGPRTEQTVVVVDGGFRDSGDQIVDHVARYYGTNLIDLVISTHPDADHVAGLEVVLERCGVGQLWMHRPWNHADDIAGMFKDGRVTDNSIRANLRASLDSARSLEGLAIKKGIPIKEPFAGVSHESGCLYVLGPTESYYRSLLPAFRGTPEPKKAMVAGATAQPGVMASLWREAKEVAAQVAEGWGIETLGEDGETSAENNSSTVLLLLLDGEYAILTGDAGIPALTQALDLFEGAGLDKSAIRFVQVPHHGSKRNVSPSLLDKWIGPKQGSDRAIRTAFVSAAKDGGPKHPAKKVANAFRRRGAPIHATQGAAKWHYSKGAPARYGYSASAPLPFYPMVDE